jgi:hypothetical protein
MRATEWLAAIAALERTLARRLTERSAQCGALLNALAAHVEPPGADARVVENLVSALRALLEGCGVDPRQGDVDKKLDALVHARPVWPAPPTPTDDDPEPLPAFSLGPNAIAEVAYLRYQLGLSVAYVHRHLSQHMGMRMPPDDLLRCIAQAVPPSSSRRSRR